MCVNQNWIAGARWDVAPCPPQIRGPHIMYGLTIIKKYVWTLADLEEMHI